jgi:hypothetical protein
MKMKLKAINNKCRMCVIPNAVRNLEIYLYLTSKLGDIFRFLTAFGMTGKTVLRYGKLISPPVSC